MIIDLLTEFSNKYGSDTELVLAGGGNTSAKDGDTMYIKGSGTSLSTITADGFVKMDRSKLAAMFEKSYPETDTEREAEALADLMAARMAGEENKRPSVETTLHSLFPQTFVLHLHPALVNGLTCALDGEKIANELFGNDMLWIGLCRPGYVLAKLCSDRMKEYKAEYGKNVNILLLQNHGIFVAADTVDGLDKLLASVMDKLKSRVTREPSLVATTEYADTSEQKKIISDFYGEGSVVLFNNCEESKKIALNGESAAVMLKPFTPDHIVYCKAYPLYNDNLETLSHELEQFKAENGYAPKIIITKGLGFFAVGANQKDAATAQMLFLDAIKIAVYSDSFGGALHMTQELVDFIVNWEVEAYRQKQN